MTAENKVSAYELIRQDVKNGVKVGQACKNRGVGYTSYYYWQSGKDRHASTGPKKRRKRRSIVETMTTISVPDQPTGRLIAFIGPPQMVVDAVRQYT